MKPEVQMSYAPLTGGHLWISETSAKERSNSGVCPDCSSLCWWKGKESLQRDPQDGRVGKGQKQRITTARIHSLALKQTVPEAGKLEGDWELQWQNEPVAGLWGNQSTLLSVMTSCRPLCNGVAESQETDRCGRGKG